MSTPDACLRELAVVRTACPSLTPSVCNEQSLSINQSFAIRCKLLHQETKGVALQRTKLEVVECLRVSSFEECVGLPHLLRLASSESAPFDGREVWNCRLDGTPGERGEGVEKT